MEKRCELLCIDAYLKCEREKGTTLDEHKKGLDQTIIQGNFFQGIHPDRWWIWRGWTASNQPRVRRIVHSNTNWSQRSLIPGNAFSRIDLHIMIMFQPANIAGNRPNPIPIFPKSQLAGTPHEVDPIKWKREWIIHSVASWFHFHPSTLIQGTVQEWSGSGIHLTPVTIPFSSSESSTIQSELLVLIFHAHWEERMWFFPTYVSFDLFVSTRLEWYDYVYNSRSSSILAPFRTAQFCKRKRGREIRTWCSTD